jgi:uncharacterized protein YjlB
MKTTYQTKIIFHYHIHDNGVFPNNTLPVILYKSVFELPLLNPGGFIITEFKNNSWENAWKNGVYDYHHYHSTAHEVLGIYRGNAKLLLGGEDGIVIEAEQGDALVIPAGVSHKNISPGAKFKCVGAYPEGQNYDMNYGAATERPKTDENIKEVPLPLMDPVFGQGGPLIELWKVRFTTQKIPAK